MRLNTMALGLLFPAAALLTGCGAGPLVSPSASAANSSSHTITGKVHGGQLPVTGSKIALYTFGSSGYGSRGQLLAVSTTDSSGYFNIDPASISCPTPDAPVYILSIGGNPGTRNNNAIELGAGLGRCADAANYFVTINEISTVALAYTFSHFFGVSGTDGNSPDSFGAPASQTQVISNGVQGTLPTLIDIVNSYPHPNTATFNFEGAKLISLANILGACVNSGGPTSGFCQNLFLYSQPAGGNLPANTLQAAVDIARNPTQNVPFLFALQPQSGASAFSGGLTAAPADFTLSASYTSPTFGLAVDTRSTSTIDIDTNGRVWFPSNAPGAGGVGYYNQANGTFSSLFPGNLTHPQELAIDIDNYVWVTDAASGNVAGFPADNPQTPVVLNLPGTRSTSVTTAYDNTMRVGIKAPDGLPALAQIVGKSSYTQLPGTEIGNGGDFVASSLAGDVIGGLAIAGSEISTPSTYDLYSAPNGQVTYITYQTFQDAGQVVFTGNNFVGTRAGYSAGADGLCIWASQNCFPMANDGIRQPSGLSLDGAGTLWAADRNAPSVESVPFVNGSYLNSNGAVNNTVYVHDSNNGNTLLHPAGIAVDRAGNVWVSNFGCYGNGCTPGAFTLSEIIGAGTPTITPVSRQVVIDDLAGTEPQVKKTGSAQ